MTILLGLAFAGLVPFSQREWRVPLGAGGRPRGRAAARLPLRRGLDAVHRPHPRRDHQPVAQRGDAPARGALLAGVYCIGLGLPFIIAAIAYRRALGAFAFVRRHQQWVTRLGGLMLVLVGLALVTGWWDLAVNWLQIHLVANSTAGL